MRRGTLRKLLQLNPDGLTWNQASGAYDPRAGVVGYRTIEGREYKIPTNPREEKAAVDRIIKAANKRLRRAGQPTLTNEEFYAEGIAHLDRPGQEQAPEGRLEGTEAPPVEAPELDFGSFLQSK